MLSLQLQNKIKRLPLIKLPPSLVKQSLDEKIAHRLNLKITDKEIYNDAIKNNNGSIHVSYNCYTHLTPNREFDNFNFPKSKQIMVKHIKKYYQKIENF